MKVAITHTQDEAGVRYRLIKFSNQILMQQFLIFSNESNQAC